MNTPTPQYPHLTPEMAASRGAAILAHLSFVGCPVPEREIFAKCECNLDDFQHLESILEEGGYINIGFSLVTVTDLGYSQGCEVLDAMRKDGIPLPPNHPRMAGIPAGGIPDSGWRTVHEQEPMTDSDHEKKMRLAALLASMADYPEDPLPSAIIMAAWKVNRAQFDEIVMPLIRANLITIDSDGYLHLTLKGNAAGRAINRAGGLPESASD